MYPQKPFQTIKAIIFNTTNCISEIIFILLLTLLKHIEYRYKTKKIYLDFSTSYSFFNALLKNLLIILSNNAFRLIDSAL